MMNEERYILAMLKRKLLTEQSKRGSELWYANEILAMIAEIEADAVLGEETDDGLPFEDQEVE